MWFAIVIGRNCTKYFVSATKILPAKVRKRDVFGVQVLRHKGHGCSYLTTHMHESQQKIVPKQIGPQNLARYSIANPLSPHLPLICAQTAERDYLPLCDGKCSLQSNLAMRPAVQRKFRAVLSLTWVRQLGSEIHVLHTQGSVSLSTLAQKNGAK